MAEKRKDQPPNRTPTAVQPRRKPRLRQVHVPRCLHVQTRRIVHSAFQSGDAQGDPNHRHGQAHPSLRVADLATDRVLHWRSSPLPGLLCECDVHTSRWLAPAKRKSVYRILGCQRREVRNTNPHPRASPHSGRLRWYPTKRKTPSLCPGFPFHSPFEASQSAGGEIKVKRLPSEAIMRENAGHSGRFEVSTRRAKKAGHRGLRLHTSTCAR